MTKFVVLHTNDGCVVCNNISETNKTITIEVGGYIIEDVPKNIVTDYV